MILNVDIETIFNTEFVSTCMIYNILIVSCCRVFSWEKLFNKSTVLWSTQQHFTIHSSDNLVHRNTTPSDYSSYVLQCRLCETAGIYNLLNVDHIISDCSFTKTGTSGARSLQNVLQITPMHKQKILQVHNGVHMLQFNMPPNLSQHSDRFVHSVYFLYVLWGLTAFHSFYYCF
jgi:hypothetical protein